MRVTPRRKWDEKSQEWRTFRNTSVTNCSLEVALPLPLPKTTFARATREPSCLRGTAVSVASVPRGSECSSQSNECQVGPKPVRWGTVRAYTRSLSAQCGTWMELGLEGSADYSPQNQSADFTVTDPGGFNNGGGSASSHNIHSSRSPWNSGLARV